MNKPMLTILTSILTFICFMGTFITMSSGDQGTFIGGLMVGCFWLGRLMK